ncbi:MAG: sensor histidine kinase [Dysgonomonas sp.]
MHLNSNNIIIKLLISPRLKILRHLLLFMSTLAVSAGFIWFAQDQGLELTIYEKCIGLLLLACIFSAGHYLNIYILTPKFLFKNRWGIYFGSLLAIALLILIVTILFRIFLEKNSNSPLNPGITSYSPLFTSIINILSSILSLSLFYAGSSTLVLFKNWILDKQQSEELESTTLQLELKLLENQINPHFLFNMLNNANIMIKKEPDIALHIINKLEEMLRYLMNNNTHEKVFLREEILFLTDFLELEKTRRDFFNYSVSKEEEFDDIQIHPLLFIAFVENAVKHNQDSQSVSYVHISFRIENNNLIFTCENSIPQKTINKQSGGIGLTNIKRRLDLLYKGNYSLQQSKTDMNYTVKLKLKL